MPIKKLLTIFFALLTLNSFSQKKTYDIGFEAGINYGSLRGNEFANDFYKSKFSYSAGAFVEYSLNDIYALRSGLYYDRKGASYDIDETNEVGDIVGIVHGTTNLDYLVVPFLLRAHFGKETRFFINGGPFVGFLISAKDKIDEFKPYPGYEYDTKDNYNKTDIGLSFGAGMSFPFGKRFEGSFEFKDNLGLTNIASYDNYFFGKVKTNALYFLLGFSCRLGHVAGQEFKGDDKRGK